MAAGGHNAPPNPLIGPPRWAIPPLFPALVAAMLAPVRLRERLVARERRGWRSHPVVVELRRLGLLVILGHAILFSGILLRHESLILLAVALMTGAILLAVVRVALRRPARTPATADLPADDA